jgi:hypothetical protein
MMKTTALHSIVSCCGWSVRAHIDNADLTSTQVDHAYTLVPSSAHSSHQTAQEGQEKAWGNMCDACAATHHAGRVLHRCKRKSSTIPFYCMARRCTAWLQQSLCTRTSSFPCSSCQACTHLPPTAGLGCFMRPTLTLYVASI